MPEFATWGEYDRAYQSHVRDGASLVQMMLGAAEVHDETGWAGDDATVAETWRRYLAKMREWDARRPQWSPDA